MLILNVFFSYFYTILLLGCSFRFQISPLLALRSKFSNQRIFLLMPMTEGNFLELYQVTISHRFFEMFYHQPSVTSCSFIQFCWLISLKVLSKIYLITYYFLFVDEVRVHHNKKVKMKASPSFQPFIITNLIND